MKKRLLLALPFLLIQIASADDQLRNVQTELKSQGFYYGEVNGQQSGETTAALRRFQIRNGLAVTGTLNEETMRSLGIGGSVPKPQTAPPAPVIPAPQPMAPKHDAPTAAESDRNFLMKEEFKHARDAASERPAAVSPSSGGYHDPSPAPESSTAPVTPPTRPDAPVAPEQDFPIFYASTPYFTAPREVQRETLRRAEAILAERGFYRDPLDGVPGPAVEEALLRFQRHTRLPLSGRLHLQTLAELRLLPSRDRDGNPLKLKPFYRENAASEEPAGRVYRGIQVD